jgi:exonuclease III
MKRSKCFISLVVGIIAAMVSGCATSPSNADRMREHRSDTEVRAQVETELKDQLAQDWEKGKNLIASGNKNIAEGEKMIESSERDLRSGKNQVELGKRQFAEGTELVRDSESRFRDAFGDIELSRSK